MGAVIAGNPPAKREAAVRELWRRGASLDGPASVPVDLVVAPGPFDLSQPSVGRRWQAGQEDMAAIRLWRASLPAGRGLQVRQPNMLAHAA